MGQYVFEFWSLMDEFCIFGFGIEVYDLFDVGLVVLGVVEYDDFVIGWQVFDIVLEVLLVVFDFVWFFQCDDVGVVWIQVFYEMFDGVVFVGCIVVFEEDDNFLFGFFDLGLEFEEFDLQVVFLVFVIVLLYQVFVWIIVVVLVFDQFFIWIDW